MFKRSLSGVTSTIILAKLAQLCTKGAKGEFLKCNFPSEFVPVIVCNKSLTNCAVHEQLVFHNEVDVNGKRIVPRGNLLAIEESFVLDKPNRKYEPKTLELRVTVEESLYDFDTDSDDTFVLTLADGSEFVFTPENIVDFGGINMPGSTNVLKALQKAWILAKFGITITTTSVGEVANSNKYELPTLSERGIMSRTKTGRQYVYTFVNQSSFPYTM
jgi:hypothetical protein